VTFSVKLGCQWKTHASVKSLNFLWISTNLVSFMQIFDLPVVGNNILAYLLPNCSNEMWSNHLHVTVCHMRSSCIYILIFCNCMLVSKMPKTLHANILLLYTDRTSERACEFLWSLKNLSVNCPWNMTCFQEASVQMVMTGQFFLYSVYIDLLSMYN